MDEIDAFMDELDPNIDVIWGVSDDNSLGQDAKVTILATGLDNELPLNEAHDTEDDAYYVQLMNELYHPHQRRRNKQEATEKDTDIMMTVVTEDGLQQPISLGKEEAKDTSKEESETTGNEQVIAESDNRASEEGRQPEDGERNPDRQPRRDLTFVERLKLRIQQLGDILLEDKP